MDEPNLATTPATECRMPKMFYLTLATGRRHENQSFEAGVGQQKMMEALSNQGFLLASMKQSFILALSNQGFLLASMKQLSHKHVGLVPCLCDLPIGHKVDLRVIVGGGVVALWCS